MNRSILRLSLLLVLAPTTAWTAPPTLTHLFPAGGQRGTKVVVTCAGIFTWPVKVSAPGLEVVPAKEAGKLEVSIPKDLAADRVWIRLYNSEGASTAAPFLIDNLKEIMEQEPNDEPRTAQVLADANVVVNGILEKIADVDCFAVRLTAGQTLVAIVDANDRLGSPMDPILQITNPEGFVLAENNDGVHLDPRLTFTPIKSGTYIVRLFAFSSTPNTTIALGGGANYVYRLTLTTGPYVTHSIPLSASHEKPGAVEVLGWNVPPKTMLPVAPFGGSKDTEHFERENPNDLKLSPAARLGFAFAPNLAGWARVRLTSDAVSSVIGIDPKKETPLTLPASVTGLLRTARQIDTFRVPLKKERQFIASVESNSLGFPFDPAVKLTAPDGKVVLNVAGSGPNREALIVHTPAKDGDFQLAVSDRFRLGGDRCFYRLSVRLDEPDFELTATVDSIVAAPGKPAELPIKVQRRAGSVGPITIQAIGLSPGVTAVPVVVEPTGPLVTVTLKLATTGRAFSGPVRIVGKAKQPREIERFVRTAPRLGATFESIWLTVIEAPKSKEKT